MTYSSRSSRESRRSSSLRTTRRYSHSSKMPLPLPTHSLRLMAMLIWAMLGRWKNPSLSRTCNLSLRWMRNNCDLWLSNRQSSHSRRSLTRTQFFPITSTNLFASWGLWMWSWVGWESSLSPWCLFTLITFSMLSATSVSSNRQKTRRESGLLLSSTLKMPIITQFMNSCR